MGEAQESQKGPTRNLLLEARVELTKLNSRASAAERRCQAAAKPMRVRYAEIVKTATAAIRTAVRTLGKTSDDMFDEVSRGTGEISASQFGDFVKSLPEHGLSTE